MTVSLLHHLIIPLCHLIHTIIFIEVDKGKDYSDTLLKFNA